MDPVVYFFVLGLAARLLRSDLKLPGVLYESLTIYLLLAIGIKGGVELASHPAGPITVQVAAALCMGMLLPLIAFPLLRYAGKFDSHNAGAIAAHYGSVSVVTFAVGLAYLAQRNVAYEAYMPLFVAVLEAPGIIVGIMLGRMADSGREARWPVLLREVLLGKSIVLLLGGLLIGWLAGPTAIAPVKPFFFDLFKGALCLFLLEMGLIVAARAGDLRKAARHLLVGSTKAAAGGHHRGDGRIACAVVDWRHHAARDAGGKRVIYCRAGSGAHRVTAGESRPLAGGGTRRHVSV